MSIPSVEWDGRKIAWDKDNKYTATKTRKESLYVRTALVKYAGSTLTEIPGAEVTAVKIDPKAVKKASIENKTVYSPGIDVKYYDTQNNKEQTLKAYVEEAKLIGTLPTFRITVKVKGKDSKKYNKKIKEVLDKESFEFGIYQRGIGVNDPTKAGVYKNEYYGENAPLHCKVELGETEGAGADTLSACSIKSFTEITASSNDITKEGGIQDELVKSYGEGGYVYDLDKDSHIVGKLIGVDDNLIYENGLKISKFNNDKAVIADVVRLYKDGEYTGTGEVVLKPKKDYKLVKGKLAGEDIYYLEFDGDNYAYLTTWSDKFQTLGAFGYKYAFRKSPGEKSKNFRYGIYADTDVGFVYNAE